MIVQDLPRIGLTLGLIVLLIACAAPAAPTATPPPTAATAPTILPTAPPSPTPAPSPTAAPPPTAAPSPSPAPPPTVTEAPRATAPERPAGTTVFAGFKASFEDGKWVQRNSKGELRTVWDAEKGKWVIDASVTRLAIGTEMEDAGMVAALPAAEIAQLMKLPENQNKIPLPVGTGSRVIVRETVDKAPLLEFKGMNNGDQVYCVFSGDYSNGINSGGSVMLSTVGSNGLFGMFLPGRYQTLLKSKYGFGEVVAIADGGNDLKLPTAEGDLVIGGTGNIRVTFENMLTNGKGQMVAFSSK